MKKNSFFYIIQNFSYTLSSNIISLLISSLVIFVVPKLIGLEEYGYWQVYLFYSSYVGFLHFGWNDGIYLRYGGEQYRNLDKKLFFSQFWMLFLTQIILSFVIVLGSRFLFGYEENEIFIFNMIAVNLVFVNMRYMLLYILQATNKMKEYSVSTILDRLIYILLILSLVNFGIKHYKPMIVVDLVGKFISLLYLIYICRDIVIRKFSDFYFSFKETFENIKVGINLMFANIASSLILGIIKFGIQRVWSVATFGKVSLTLSVSNLLMTFINALSLAIFPILRRTNRDKLPNMYSIIRTLLMVALLGLLVIYYPLKEVLSLWLPQYADSLEYMALIFPMVVYEGKVALLTNTYLKTLRKERTILKVNVITVFISLLSTLMLTFYFENLILTMLSIVFLLAFRCILSELILSKIMDIDVKKDIILEIILTIIFILSSWFIDSWVGVLLYLVFYFIYLIIKKKDILKTYRLFKKMLKE